MARDAKNEERCYDFSRLCLRSSYFIFASCLRISSSYLSSDFILFYPGIFLRILSSYLILVFCVSGGKVGERRGQVDGTGAVATTRWCRHPAHMTVSAERGETSYSQPGRLAEPSYRRDPNETPQCVGRVRLNL